MGEKRKINLIKKFTVRMFLAVLAGISAVLMFLPAYTMKVTEDGITATIELSGWHTFLGKLKGSIPGMTMVVQPKKLVSEFGRAVGELDGLSFLFDFARTEMILCLIIPVAVIVLLYVVRRYEEDLIAKIVVGISAVNVVIWFSFHSKIKEIFEMGGVKEELQDVGGKVGPTFWFWMNIVVLVLIVVVAVFVAMKKITLDMEVKEAFECVKNSAASNGANRTSAAIAYCASCGGPLTGESPFCANCGNPVPVEVQEEAARRAEEATRRAPAANEVAFCPNCGIKLSADSAFCANCGSKVK